MPRYPGLAVAALAAGLAGSAGCANLVVTKVPVEARAAGRDDHVGGFRYYLTRPYVAVLQPIPVSERRTLVLAKPGQPGLSYADGPRAGQPVPADRVVRADPGAGRARPVSAAELQALKSAFAADAGPDPGVRPADATAPDTGGLDDPGPAPGVPPAAAINSPALENPYIRIYYLPDLDEQYAVRSRNVLAKSAFRMDFGLGSRLDGVSAEHDTTALTVAVLRTIDQVVNAEKTLADARLDREKSIREDGARLLDPGGATVYFQVETVVIKPGLYRLNKPWECDGPACPAGVGLLAKLGLPTVTTFRIEAVTK
jgi:hypothetical protein